jgi:hypothetical protein
MFGGCSCGGPFTDGVPCHHMVAVVKSSRIERLTATNSMPVWWTMECWHNQYPADTNETCHFDMDTLRSTAEDAAMRYCPPYAAPRKAGHPKNNNCMKSPSETQFLSMVTIGFQQLIVERPLQLCNHFCET